MRLNSRLLSSLTFLPYPLRSQATCSRFDLVAFHSFWPRFHDSRFPSAIWLRCGAVIVRSEGLPQFSIPRLQVHA